MTQADQLESPQGNPLHEVAFRAISEGLDGQGIISAGDFAVSADGATAMGYLVDAGTMWYNGGVTNLGAQRSDTVAAADANDDRWDTIAWDTSTGSVVEKTGTAEANPEPPDVGSDEVLLAYIYVEAGATDFDDSKVFNWRPHHQGGGNTRLEDTAGDFNGDTVEAAFTEVIREAGDPLNGPLDLSSFSGGAVLDLGDNFGGFGPLVDGTVDGNSAQGTSHTYDLQIDGTTILRVYAESDGSGGLQNVTAKLPEGTDLPTGDIDTADLADGSVTTSEIEDGTITDADIDSSTTIARGKLDDHKATATVDSDSYTTQDEEVVFVDTASIGGASTITLASADAEDGNTIVVSDLTGSARDGPITVDTESGETIHGQSSKTIDTEGGALVFTSDGMNWSLGGGGAGGGGTESTEIFEGREGGEVADGDQGIVVVDNLSDGETVEVYKAVLTTATAEAVPSGVSLELVTFANDGSYMPRTTLISGDGSTVFDRETGDPLASWENETGDDTSIGVFVDNGSGSVEEVFAAVEGVTYE